MLPKAVSVLMLSGLSASLAQARSNSEDFDDHSLRQNVASLAGEWQQFLSPAEQRALRVALKASPAADIDRMLEGRAQIEVSINPEGRVSVHKTQAWPPSMRCGANSTWLIRVLNTGYVTAPLRVRLVDEPEKPESLENRPVTVNFTTTKLTGGKVEYRVMDVSMKEATPTDVTLLFEAGPDTADLGSRAELPVLLRCK